MFQHVATLNSGSRETLTAMFAAFADGTIAPPMIVFKGISRWHLYYCSLPVTGIRNYSGRYLGDLQPGAKSGRWLFEMAPNGMMTEDVFMKVDISAIFIALEDIDFFSFYST